MQSQQTQPSAAKGELLFEIQGKTVSSAVREITPHGLKLEMNDEGQTTGKFNGQGINTTTVFLKTDGTNEWEGKGFQTSKDGDMLVISARGTGRMTGPSTGTWQGEVAFMTQSPKLAWLNTTKGWLEGEGNMAQRTFHGKVYAKKQ